MRVRFMTCCTVAALAALAGESFAQEKAALSQRQLEDRVAELTAQVQRLEEILAGTAHPVNLGRTSLAAVSASSVNGGRAMGNVYYGVVNAFDDGRNWHNDINYTYWLSNGEPGPWIEVQFNVPVTITSIGIEGGPAFSTLIGFDQGGERFEPVSEGKRMLDPEAHGVRRIRLTFEPAGVSGADGNAKVHEIRVMGHVPSGVEYEVARPRILVDAQNAELIAREAFGQWVQSMKMATALIREEEDAIVVTFRREDVDLYRVKVRRADGEVRAEPLADWKSIADE